MTNPNFINPFSLKNTYKEEMVAQMQQQLEQIKEQLQAMKGHVVSLGLIQCLVNKMQAMSDELANNEVAYLNCLNDVSRDMASLIEDIKEMESKGVDHNTDGNIYITDADVAKFTADLNQFQTDAIKLQALSKQDGIDQDVWQDGNIPDRDVNVYNMIADEQTGYGKALKDLINDGDTHQMKLVFQGWANDHYTKVKNNDQSDANSPFDQFIDGTNGADGLDTFNNIIVSGRIADMNNEVQKDAQIVSSCQSTAQGMGKNINDFYTQLIKQQISA
jgi:hypothetical protein